MHSFLGYAINRLLNEITSNSGDGDKDDSDCILKLRILESMIASKEECLLHVLRNNETNDCYYPKIIHLLFENKESKGQQRVLVSKCYFDFRIKLIKTTSSRTNVSTMIRDGNHFIDDATRDISNCSDLRDLFCKTAACELQSNGSMMLDDGDLKGDESMIVDSHRSIVAHTTKAKAGAFFKRFKEESTSRNSINGDNSNSLHTFLKVKGKNKS